jgi:hypothetical protein
MQIGMQGNARTALADTRVMTSVRLGASTEIAGPLIGNTDTGTESVGFSHANEQLMNEAFALPAGQDLRVAVMSSTASQAFDYVVYGMD